jgi:hypothetical protein
METETEGAGWMTGRATDEEWNPMKTAYELAMERLQKASPDVPLTDEQKRALAELDSRYKAKEAERELLLRGEIDRAIAKGDFEAQEQLEKQLASDRRTLRSELEEKKEEIRRQPPRS